VSFLFRVLLGAVGLWLSAKIVPGVVVHGVVTLLAAALLLGIVNALVRPILVFLTFPLTVLTLGLFLLVVNAAMILLVSGLLKGFDVHGLWPAIGAAVVTGLVSWVGDAALERDRARTP
jgi:putative membrane protein